MLESHMAPRGLRMLVHFLCLCWRMNSLARPPNLAGQLLGRAPTGRIQTQPL